MESVRSGSFLPPAVMMFVLFFLTTFISAGESPLQNTAVPDPHSFARPQEAAITHLDLDIRVDFERRQIIGRAALEIDNKTAARQLILDTRDLTIKKVTLGSEETPAEYHLGQVQSFLGRPLVVAITPDTRRVNIDYQTDPNAAALQWLTPAQTTGGRHPFLFTQSQAILARTWIPCQDSPGVRITYHARVRTDPALLAVMSAENPQTRSETGLYEFDMPQPIPAYLLALAVGDLQFHSFDERSGVYAEPEVLARASAELVDTPRMIAAAENLYGPYRWGRYDLIVLPPSFPFGGMENPRLTFATPTILAGDRSLVALVAHELAHSWSGNLVTNATWNDFWLNEGFTTYFENRIMEALYGEDYAAMLAHLGYQDAREEVNRLGAEHPDTHLFLNLAGRDPDEGMTNIAYEKGRLFLRMLEEHFGRPRWDGFLRSYFDSHLFQSMSTSGFLSSLREHLLEDDAQLWSRLQIDAWVYGPGLPGNCPVPRSPEFERVEEQVRQWLDGRAASQLNTDGWTTHHWLHFLRTLPLSMATGRLQDLDAAFGFTTSGNSEILAAWFRHTIASGYPAADAALERFLTTVGRRKFLEPLYQQLAQTPQGLERARKIYQKARPGYHPVSYQTIDQILGISS